MITTFQIPFMIWLHTTILSLVPPVVVIFVARFVPWIFLGGIVVLLLLDMLYAMATKRYVFFKISFWEVFFTFSIALFFQWACKILTAVPRPFLEGITPLYYYGWNDSFPSGHMLIFTALAVVIYHRYKTMGIIAIIVAFLIGIARIVVGIHWPLDIIAGALLGVAIGRMVIYFIHQHYRK